MESKEFGIYLKSLRGDLSIGKVELRTGISKSYISRVENGERRPSPDILKKLAECYDVPYDTLMVKAGYLEGESPRRILGYRLSKLSPEDLAKVNEYIDKILEEESK